MTDRKQYLSSNYKPLTCGRHIHSVTGLNMLRSRNPPIFRDSVEKRQHKNKLVEMGSGRGIKTTHNKTLSTHSYHKVNYIYRIDPIDPDQYIDDFRSD